MELLIFAAVWAAGCGIFLLRSGGGKAAGLLLKRRIPMLQELPERAVLLVLLLPLAGAAAGGVSDLIEARSDTARAGFLVRNGYGEGDYEAELVAEDGEEQKEVTLPVEARTLSREEIRTLLAEASAGAKAQISAVCPLDHVDRDLPLPSEIAGNPVRIDWTTDRPDLLDWDGILQETVPEYGTEMHLIAEYTLESETLSESCAITVFPKEMTEAERFTAGIRRKIREENHTSDEVLALPEEADGKKLSWSRKQSRAGGLLFLLSLLAALLLPSVFRKRREEELEKREAELRIDYPQILSQLVLFLGAGLSLRGAVFRIAELYAGRLARGGGIRPGFEEFRILREELKNGVPETEAYERLGARAGEAHYRALSVLLIQNLKKGGPEFFLMLRKEAEDAMGERRRAARIAGEKAGTKLLLPMVGMLAVIMGIVTVPVFFSL